MGHVMEVQYDADAKRIWALCDNTCGVTSTVLKVSSTGTIVPDVAYSKPAGLPVNNLEGFALAPSSTCVDGTKEVVWSDDGLWGTGVGTPGEGHALYSGRISCDLGLGGQGVPPGPAAWDRGATYTAGNEVTYAGAVFRAPVVDLRRGPGQQRVRLLGGDRDGRRRHRDLDALAGLHRPATWSSTTARSTRRMWWTRHQAPGGVGGPWTAIPAPVPAGSSPAWSAATVYVGGEKVTYLGHTYQAQWWTSGVTPGTAWSAWKLLA